MAGRSPSRARVAVDALGGDHGLPVVVEGALLACKEFPVRVTLVGPRATVEAELARRHGKGETHVEVVDAPDLVDMAEKVSRATLKKRSSIHVGTELVRDGAADAFFSAGNTAACWTIAKLLLGTLSGVDRPALATVVPSLGGRTVLLDVGANATCKARHLQEFAVMGEAYCRCMFATRSPRVGLMSMGEEEGKGTDLTREVHDALKESRLNFVGNVEGRDLFSGKVDVIVMDGFTGNVVLKASEALAESLITLLREELRKTFFRKAGAFLSQHALLAVKKRTDASEYGGAPLLGVNGCCVVGHGRSGANAIKHGIRAAADFHRSGVNGRIEEQLRQLPRVAVRA